MSEIDDLMSLDPLGLSEQDIDKIIAHQRAQRARFEAGEKPKREKGPSIDISGVISAMTAKAPVVGMPKRRL